MGQVADSGGDKVVFLVVQDNRQGAQGLDKFLKPIHCPWGCFSRWGDNVIHIFKKVCGSMAVPAFFRASHGMPANKIRGQGGICNFLMDCSFHAAHICNGAIAAGIGR